MIEQLKTIRNFIESAYATNWPRVEDRNAAHDAIEQLEAMAGEQEPVAYYYQKHNCFGQLVWNVGFVAPGDATHCYPLYTAAPVAQQPPIRALGAPSRTEWGFGMVCIDIELGKDSTATVFFDLDDTEKVERRFGVEIKRD